ncbi:MAG TPA: BON domain-containing protein [Casimicrobiaceae bacterium]
MTRKLATACFVIGASLAPIVAHATDVDAERGRPEAYAKDSLITTKIKAKLAAEHLESLKNIRVDTDANGTVWLSGTVGSSDEARKAITIARNTDGVKSVSSKLRVESDR